MEITRTAGTDCVRLALCGRLDAAWSASVQAALDDCVRAGQHAIELDLEQVAFMSSAGIRVLLVTYRRLHGIDGRLAIVAASPAVREVLELSGLRALLEGAAPAPAAADAPAVRRLETATACYEVHPVDPRARLRVQALGDPTPWLAGGVTPPPLPLRCSPERLAVGVGAFGDAAGCGERLGELLAVAGAAATLPGGAEGRPDWMVCEERLVPEAQLAYGLVGDGAFAWQARCDAHDGGAVPLAALVETALEIATAEAIGLVVVAETAQLVGAARRATPTQPAPPLFTFPAVRTQLDFTAEPAFADRVAVIAGFAARAPHAALAAHLRPLAPDGALQAHLHAAVFPYRPLRKGRLELAATVRALFESQSLLGLLHLLHDWRPSTGAGQSMLHRGALWVAPLDVEGAA